MVEFPKQEWKDYSLLDSGNGMKLERFGRYTAIRPEPKALWEPSMSKREWQRLASVRFKPGTGLGKPGKEDSGIWEKIKEMPDRWFIGYPGDGFELQMRLGLTAFKHVGIFPEQAPNWEYIFRNSLSKGARGGLQQNGSGALQQGDLGKPAKGEQSFAQQLAGRPQAAADRFSPVATDQQKVLNLFAYTGGASLAARAAGADVTHLDSVRQVVSWARENMEATGLSDIRWVIEDAMKFVKREAKRGRLYDGIILDPPAYGHGPSGEKWKLDELLFEMLKTVALILEPNHGWMVLNLYSNGYSAGLGETIVREAFGLKPKAVKARQPDTLSDQRNTCKISSRQPDAPSGRWDADKNSSKSAGADNYKISSGELALNDPFGKALPLSIFVRLQLGD
jgi:23S rRNA (cytosine1962-C5)-methyltransferase